MNNDGFVAIQKPRSIVIPLYPVAILDVSVNDLAALRDLKFDTYCEEGLGEFQDSWLMDRDRHLYAICGGIESTKVSILIEQDLPEGKLKVESLIEWLRILRPIEACWYGST